MSTVVKAPLPPSLRGRGVTAVLGPTNTGKTHLAIERLLTHSSGMIGLPLRLLAREVYARVAARVGEGAVALITGEERIIPPHPRFWVSTVEAMPRDIDVAFLAIDEIQLAGDLERGHVFTDRILNSRGREETLLLGALTMRGLLEKLIPGINVVTRPRMSVLTWSGQKKITRLPARSAIVAFSSEEVYAIAELIRRQSGGAAVVMGALSPRTRNAQVELFQNGDVDYLVATDAIGMGLNLDVDHVAFAGNRKFDGYQYRQLTLAELGQVAGRAGRHTRDGTFGVTGRVDPFDDETVKALETHKFDPVRVLQWRNPRLDFRSLDALRRSLEIAPNEDGLTRAPPADDLTALEFAARQPEIRDLATSANRVELLWDVCLVPDYRKIAPANHAELITTIYEFLIRHGAIPDDWFAKQIAQADRREGDIDTLSNRIAHIRTWTYVANRPDWVKDPSHWREKTREIENGLSDALHERLTQRFVDRRTSVLMRRLRENAMLEAQISPDGDVMVEGHRVGHLAGFRFQADVTAEGQDAKAVRNAAAKALASEIETRAEKFSNAANKDIVLSIDGTIRWIGEPVARLVAGEEALKPGFTLLADEQLTGPAHDKVQTRLDLWLKAHVETLLKPLTDLRDAQDLEGMARGLAFQIVEKLGVVERQQVAEDVKSLDQPQRAGLRKYGIRFGAYHIFVPALLKPAPSALIALLWALKNNAMEVPGRADLATLSASGRTSIKTDATFAPQLYKIFGFRVCGERAVRLDILERLADIIRPLIAWKPLDPTVAPPTGAIAQGGGFTVTLAMTSLLGANTEDMHMILKSLGYRMEKRTVAKPKPVEAQPAPLVDEAAPEAAAPSGTDAEAPAEAVVETVVEAPVEADAAEAPIAETVDEPAAAAIETVEPEAEVATETAETEAPAEPETVEIEIWRPGRFERRDGQHPRRDGERGGPRGEGRGPRGDNRGDNRGERPQGDRGPRRDGGRGPQGNRAPQGGDARPEENRAAGGNQRFERRFEKRPDQDRTPRPERDLTRTEKPKRPDRPIDPDNPFAKLMALKAELENKGKK